MNHNYYFRKINLKNDADELIDIECNINYINENYLHNLYNFEEYKKRWLTGNRPKNVLKTIKNTLKDKRTICEFLLSNNNDIIAYIHLTFIDIIGFDIIIAYLENIYVKSDYRRIGIGTYLINYIKEKSQKIGAKFLSLSTSYFNSESNFFFRKNGFKINRNSYEIEL